MTEPTPLHPAMAAAVEKFADSLKETIEMRARAVIAEVLAAATERAKYNA